MPVNKFSFEMKYWIFHRQKQANDLAGTGPWTVNHGVQFPMLRQFIFPVLPSLSSLPGPMRLFSAKYATNLIRMMDSL